MVFRGGEQMLLATFLDPMECAHDANLDMDVKHSTTVLKMLI